MRWEQLGLWAVTTGDGLDGYWTAASDDAVRFVLVDGREMSSGRYTLGLVAHLAAPVVAAVALAVMAVRLRRSPAAGADPR